MQTRNLQIRFVRSRGFTLLEVTITMTLLGAALAMFVPLLSRVNAVRRASAARRAALQEAHNILERFSARDWGDVNQKTADTERLSREAGQSLHEPQLKLTVTDVAGSPPGKRVAVEIRWKNREGDYVAPVRLATFLFKEKEAP